MKVLGGSARSVPLKTVPDMNTRPILDRVKKSLFSMLDSGGLLQEARVADLYSGTGTQGIEALSRGAEHCVFAERRPDAVALMRENLAKTRLAEFAEVHCSDVAVVLRKMEEANRRFELILYDPPFVFVRASESRAAAEAELARAGNLLSSPLARLVLRMEARYDPPVPPGLKNHRVWKDGPHAFIFYGAPDVPR